MLKIYTTLFLLISISEQDPVQIGNQSFINQNFESAIEQYSYALFEIENKKRSEELHKEILIKAIFSAYMLEYDEAVVTFSKKLIPLLSQSENDIEYAINENLLPLIELIEILNETGSNPNNAILKAISFKGITPDQLRYKPLLIANAHLQNQNTERFKQYYSNFCELGDCINLREQSIKTKSIKIARNLSTVLPGTGQAYGKDYKSGIGALIITGLGGYLTGKAIVEERYIDAGIVSTLLFYRYYTGNIDAAENSVNTYNNDQLNELLHYYREIADTEISLLEEAIYHSINHLPFQN